MIYLYVKTHNKTGLKYFGKTTNKDPFKYNGSGKYWINHCNKYGYDIDTKIVFQSSNIKLCEDFAITFSRENNIVESNEWANLIEENSRDGKPLGVIMGDETKEKISSSLMGRSIPKSKYTITEEERQNRSKRFQQLHKDTFWVNNGNIQKRLSYIPDGWVKGRLNFISNVQPQNIDGNNTRGKKIYNDGFNHKYFVEGEHPEGWVRGKLKSALGGNGSHRKGKKKIKGTDGNTIWQ